jgi:UPF0271 protein
MLLNIDLGELPDEPDELYALADLANIACGGHAGDEASMRAAAAACHAHGTGVIAHPSFVDREGFGRRLLTVEPALLERQVHEQCLRLAAVAPQLRGVKAHGALYHAADRDPALAAALVRGARSALPEARLVLGPAGGALEAACVAAGLFLLVEGFADRARERGEDGRWRLVPRDRPGALLHEPAAAAAQALTLLHEGGFGTVCVHGDQPGAVAVARAVRAALGPRT